MPEVQGPAGLGGSSCTIHNTKSACWSASGGQCYWAPSGNMGQCLSMSSIDAPGLPVSGGGGIVNAATIDEFGVITVPGGPPVMDPTMLCRPPYGAVVRMPNGAPACMMFATEKTAADFQKIPYTLPGRTWTDPFVGTMPTN